MIREFKHKICTISERQEFEMIATGLCVSVRPDTDTLYIRPVKGTQASKVFTYIHDRFVYHGYMNNTNIDLFHERNHSALLNSDLDLRNVWDQAIVAHAANLSLSPNISHCRFVDPLNIHKL